MKLLIFLCVLCVIVRGEGVHSTQQQLKSIPTQHQQPIHHQQIKYRSDEVYPSQDPSYLPQPEATYPSDGVYPAEEIDTHSYTNTQVIIIKTISNALYIYFRKTKYLIK